MDAIPAIAGLPGRACKRAAKLHANKGYYYKRCRAYLRRRGIASRIARRGVEGSEKPGKHRWVVERTRLITWLVCRLWQAAHPLCKAAGYPRGIAETGRCDHLCTLRGSVVLAALRSPAHLHAGGVVTAATARLAVVVHHQGRLMVQHHLSLSLQAPPKVLQPPCSCWSLQPPWRASGSN